MRAWAIFTALLATFACPAFAQTNSATATKPAHADRSRAPVVLASADTIRATAPVKPESSTPAPKAVIPRVTTCRCGDPQSDVDRDTQDQ